MVEILNNLGVPIANMRQVFRKSDQKETGS